MQKSIYNYLGYLVEKYLPEIKNFSYYFQQDEADKPLTSFPAIAFRAAPFSVSDGLNGGRIIEMNIDIKLKYNLMQSFVWTDSKKSYTGDFLDLFDRVMNLFLLKKDVPDEYLLVRPENFRLLSFNLEETDYSQNVKTANISYRCTILDSTLVPSSSYAINEASQVQIIINDNYGQ